MTLFFFSSSLVFEILQRPPSLPSASSGAPGRCPTLPTTATPLLWRNEQKPLENYEPGRYKGVTDDRDSVNIQSTRLHASVVRLLSGTSAVALRPRPQRLAHGCCVHDFAVNWITHPPLFPTSLAYRHSMPSTPEHRIQGRCKRLMTPQTKMQAGAFFTLGNP